MGREDNFQTRPINPSRFKLTWDNSDGSFKCYDSTQKINTKVQLPLTFALIDSVISISGFNEKEQRSYFSNEVRDVRTEELTVKCGDSTIITGLYGAIKAKLELMKAKFAQNLYVMLADGSFARIQLTGSNVSAWLEFTKKAGKLTKNWITISNPQPKTKGTIKWFEPTIALADLINDADDKKADELYHTLKAYRQASYLPVVDAELKAQAVVSTGAVADAEDDDVRGEGLVDDLPF